MTAMNPYQSPGSVTLGVNNVQLQKAKEYSASLAWARGPLSVGFGYDFHQGLRPVTTANGIADPKDTAWQLGAKWNFGPGEVGLGTKKIRWNIGPGAVWASYAGAEGKSCATSSLTIGTAACGVKAKMYRIGYDYVLSKRTKMYVANRKIDNGTATTSS